MRVYNRGGGLNVLQTCALTLSLTVGDKRRSRVLFIVHVPRYLETETDSSRETALSAGHLQAARRNNCTERGRCEVMSSYELPPTRDSSVILSKSRAASNNGNAALWQIRVNEACRTNELDYRPIRRMTDIVLEKLRTAYYRNIASGPLLKLAASSLTSATMRHRQKLGSRVA